MRNRFTLWLIAMVVLCVGVSPAQAQWADVYSDEPHNLSYDLLTELSELLELESTAHEVLVGLHLEMARAENDLRLGVRTKIEAARESGEPLDWNDVMGLSAELMDDMAKVADQFYADAKLLVSLEQFPLLDHIRQRSEMRFLLRMTRDEVSGLSAQPFDLLHEQDLVSIERFRELVLANRATEAKAHDQFKRVMTNLAEVQREMRAYDFEVENAYTKQVAKMTRLFKDTIDAVKRLRDLNESLADAIMASLDEEDRAAYEEAWLERNYEEVQEETLPERVARKVLDDDQASEELKSRVRELMPNFERRLTTARKMARIAKHKSDLNFDFRQILDTNGPDRAMYEESMERLSEVAATYAAALKSAMTPEERVRYRFEEPE
ncbi:MAG: hypothetical protein ACF8MJ_04445 [Phycisphaerales bacterium JB050]